MRVSVRACLSAGVTLIGASAIAIAPVQVARPDITADRPTATRVVSDARVEFLSALRQMAPPSAAVTAEPAPLNAASDAIINAWNTALPWIDYGVNLTDYVLGFIPYGYLIGDQISIVYYSLIRPVANSFVVNLVAPVVNDPLNPASYVNGLLTLGSVTVTSLINLGINEFNYFFGWLIPPIPPLPLATAAEATTEAEPVATADAAEGVVETADDGPDIQTMVAIEETKDTDETVGKDTQDTTESEVDTTLETTVDTTPTTSTSGTVQAQGEVRGAGDQAPPDETATVPSAGDNTADSEVETESATTPEPSGEDTEANPDNVDAGSE